MSAGVHSVGSVHQSATLPLTDLRGNEMHQLSVLEAQQMTAAARRTLGGGLILWMKDVHVAILADGRDRVVGLVDRQRRGAALVSQCRLFMLRVELQDPLVEGRIGRRTRIDRIDR